MSMFDYYRPAGELHCPVCRRLLREWQGKDGPSFLFVWAEGTRFAVDQAMDEEVRLDREAREQFTLPPRFTIYSHDCPDHQPIDAACATVDGIWKETIVQPFKRPPRR
jgi:hypothetical protein